MLASEREALEEVVAGDAAGSMVGDLVGDLDGSIRSGVELGEGPYCVELLAVGEDAKSREGTLVFDAVGDPDVMLDDAAELEGVGLGEPTQSDGLVTVSFTDDEAKGLASVRIQSRLSGFGTRELEKVGPGSERSAEPDCPGA